MVAPERFGLFGGERQHLEDAFLFIHAAQHRHLVGERGKLGAQPEHALAHLLQLRDPVGAELGILGLPVPEAYGGTGSDATTTMVALEALGYACTDNGLLFSLNAQLWAIETPVIR